MPSELIEGAEDSYEIEIIDEDLYFDEEKKYKYERKIKDIKRLIPSIGYL
tara:strand:+ start:90 stop:239 length:150 start_codon:yes stop_codon:yes gene_type:complete